MSETDLKAIEARVNATVRVNADVIIQARADVKALLELVAELQDKIERRRVRLVNAEADLLDIRGALSPNGEDRKVPFPLGPRVLPAVEWLIERVAELEGQVAGRDEQIERVRAVREVIEANGVKWAADSISKALDGEPESEAKP